MIGRVRAWLGAREQLSAEITYQLETVAELRAVIARQEKQLALQREVVAGLQRQNERPCECGGDTELYWRKRAHEAERQAKQDRRNTVWLTDQVAYWKDRYSTVDHQLHIAEQLGRAT
jgi:hypothetical protein